MGKKEKRYRIVLEGVEKYLDDARKIQIAAEQTARSITQLNEALKELIELRKQILL